MNDFVHMVSPVAEMPAFGLALPLWTTPEREAPVESKRRFHAVQINGYWFWGSMGHGGPQLRAGGQSVLLGRAMLYRFPSGTWAVCDQRYSSPRMGLDGLSDRGLSRLSQEFGLPFHPAPAGSASSGFYASPSFRALRGWARENAALAKRLRGKALELRDWYDRAK